MSNWKRQPQEQKGDYWFAGNCYVTAGVNGEIPKIEIQEIITDLQKFVREQKGADYLQVYINEKTGGKIWVIDQVTKSELQDGTHPQEHNYFTVLFPEEY